MCSIAAMAGNADNGRALFEAICLVCHAQGGRGGQIGPALDGLGHTGTEAILRNIVAPSAAMEASYRTFRVITTNGDVIEGFLATEDAASVTLRIPGGPERRIERTSLRSAGLLPPITHRVHQLSTAVGLVMAGFGIALMAQHTAQHVLQPGLVARPLVEPELVGKVGLLSLASRQPSPQVRLLCEVLLDACAPSAPPASETGRADAGTGPRATRAPT